MRQSEGGIIGSEDSYLASVSDLVIGLLFIFVILLMAFGLNFRAAEVDHRTMLTKLTTERDELDERAQVLGAEAARLAEEAERLSRERDRLIEVTQELDALTSILRDRDAQRQDLLEEIQSYLNARGVDVNVDPESGILRLPEELLFASGEALIRPEGERALTHLADVLAKILPCYSRVAESEPRRCPDRQQPILEAVLVEGHTDNRPIRNEEFRDNWELGTVRGINTFRALTAAQPALEGLLSADDQPLLGVSSYEARRPIDVADSDASLARNRRIDLRFVVAAPSAEDIRDFRMGAGDYFTLEGAQP